MEIKEIKNEQVENKGVSKFARAKKWVQKTVASVMVAGMTAYNSTMTAYAVNSGTSPGTDATSYMNYAWWIVIGILGIFAALGVIKMVQGVADEDTRGRNNGITTLIVSGAGIVIVGLIKTATT
ncbi:MAG: hypothetical protein IJ265_07755 [Oscillospiraceae bacterium]|nr:hypothetical protein [Oscillospiraceae bacterium]